MTTVSNGAVMSEVASALSRGVSIKEVQDAADDQRALRVRRFGRGDRGICDYAGHRLFFYLRYSLKG